MPVKMLRLFVLVFSLLGGLGACSGNKEPLYAGALVKQYGGEKTTPDVVEKRVVSLSHPASAEKLTETYYVDGRYDFQSLGRINALLRDRRSGRIFRIDPELVDFLVDLRTRLALPPSAVFEILSGYRESETNAALRREDKPAARNSLHVQGRAVDFRLVNVNGRAVAEVAKTMQRGGVSYYPGSNHVHLDTGALRSWAAEQ